jgi:hypothetical protein
LGFIYKEGDADFKIGDNNGQLTNLGVLSLQRWKKGILVVHFLFSLKKQASNTHTAEGTHGQAMFADFVQAMHKYPGRNILFVFYDPTQNQSTNFLFVLNGESADKYTSVVNWKKIKRCIQLNSTSSISSSTLQQATGNYADYGFCTSQNSNRKESTTGHAMPALKPTSKVPEIIDVFVTLTTFAASNQPSWRLHDDYFSTFDPEILSEFSNKIDSQNGLPSLHLAVTCVEHPC